MGGLGDDVEILVIDETDKGMVGVESQCIKLAEDRGRRAASRCKLGEGRGRKDALKEM